MFLCPMLDGAEQTLAMGFHGIEVLDLGPEVLSADSVEAGDPHGPDELAFAVVVVGGLAGEDHHHSSVDANHILGTLSQLVWPRKVA